MHKRSRGQKKEKAREAQVSAAAATSGSILQTSLRVVLERLSPARSESKKPRRRIQATVNQNKKRMRFATPEQLKKKMTTFKTSQKGSYRQMTATHLQMAVIDTENPLGKLTPGKD